METFTWKCVKALFLNFFSLFYSTLHSQRNKRIRVRLKFPDPVPTKKVRIRLDPVPEPCIPGIVFLFKKWIGLLTTYIPKLLSLKLSFSTFYIFELILCVKLIPVFSCMRKLWQNFCKKWDTPYAGIVRDPTEVLERGEVAQHGRPIQVVHAFTGTVSWDCLTSGFFFPTHYFCSHERKVPYRSYLCQHFKNSNYRGAIFRIRNCMACDA